MTLIPDKVLLLLPRTVMKVILPYEAASVIQGLFDDETDKPQTTAKVADLSKLIVYLGRKGDTALKEIEND